MIRKLLETDAKSGAETERILLRKKDIKSCDGCLTCEQGDKERKGIRRTQNDMQVMYTKLEHQSSMGVLKVMQNG